MGVLIGLALEVASIGQSGWQAVEHPQPHHREEIDDSGVPSPRSVLSSHLVT